MKSKLHALSASEVSTPVENLEVFMKFVTAILLVIFAFSAIAESAFEKKNKEKMLERADVMITKVASARDHLKKEETKEACDEIQELLKLYPEHLKAIGTSMNNGKTKVIIARDEALQQLIFVHRQSVVCGQGENAEHVDGKELGKTLKQISKSLKKQKKLIKKETTNQENEFYYNYEF
jgi:hypothetical protein